MRTFFQAFLVAGCLYLAAPLRAEIQCNVVVNTPEDELMLAYNGADKPEEQVAALDKYAQAHADSKFMPCVNAYYTTAYMKLNNFDKSIEYGEKNFAANNGDMTLMLNLLRAYVGAGKATDTAFDVIMKTPNQIKLEANPARPPKVSDADWQKAQEDFAEQTKDQRAYAEYAFFQLLPRVTDLTKKTQYLDNFIAAYPDTTNMGQINFQYYVAYKQANNPAKADEYGEKSIALDPTNVATLNLVADDYSTRQTNLDKAGEYAKKVLELAPAMKKAEGMSDPDFKASQNTQLGLAHLTLGYVTFQKTSRTHKVGAAIQELKTAIDLLGANPQLQARALFYLGYAYEVVLPVNHRAAAEALGRAVAIASPWQGPAQQLLAKVRAAH